MSALDSPYFYRAPALARYVTSWNAFAWGLAVLIERDALAGGGSHYAWVTEYAPENVYGASLMVLGVLQLLWLAFRLPPISCRGWNCGALGYLILGVWWTFVSVSEIATVGTLHVSSLANAVTMAPLAFYAFLAYDRTNGHVPE